MDPHSRVVVPNEEITGYSAEATHASVLWALDLEYRATVDVRPR